MIQQRLIRCLYDLHRPEIADWIEGCRMTLRGHTLLVECSSSEPLRVITFPLQQWLERLLGQVVWQAGLPIERVQFIRT